MNNFVWILPVYKNISFGRSGVSSTYIIPKGEVTVSIEMLAGSRIWFLLRENDDRLFISLKIKKIERIINGYNEGDFLASGDLLNSFRLVSKFSEAKSYITKITASFDLGVSEIDAETALNFANLVTNNLEVKFAKPDANMFKDISVKILPKSGQSLAKYAIRLAVSYFNLNQIWSEGKGKKLSAFSNFSYGLLTNNVSDNIADKAIKFLSLYDPVINLLNVNSSYTARNIGKNINPPHVDLDFTEIEPKKIYVREFISSGNKFKDLEAALSKTEHAEKMHQAMLKDIAEYLLSEGIIPYESSSIDLIFQSKYKLKICEIKSTTTDNLLAQSSKGAFQLACYIEELNKSYDDILPQLILRKIGNDKIESYVERILLRMNVPVFFYDPNKSWPQKIPDFLF